MDDAPNGVYGQHVSPIEQRAVCWADIRGLQEVNVHSLIQKALLVRDGKHLVRSPARGTDGMTYVDVDV